MRARSLVGIGIGVLVAVCTAVAVVDKTALADTKERHHRRIDAQHQRAVVYAGTLRHQR